MPDVVGWGRVLTLAVLVLIGGLSFMSAAFKLLGCMKSETGHRSIRQLLVLTTVVALWLGFARQYDSIAWQGKRLRFSARIDELEAIAAPLRDHWPERDGEIPGIGPFMAYPFGRPTTLLLLEAPPVASRSLYISAIEKCRYGAIKLQLTGTDGGDWAEWHPPLRRPVSFVGGLADPHELHTATAIGNGWYLVRYRA